MWKLSSNNSMINLEASLGESSPISPAFQEKIEKGWQEMLHNETNHNLGYARFLL